MLEHSGRDIGGQHLDPAVPIADAGIGAMTQHRLLQRHPSRIVMSVLEFRT